MENFDSKEDFLAYVALFAAHEDLVLQEEEVKWMKNRFGEERVDRITQVFLNQSEYTNLRMIQANKAKYFPEESGTQTLLDLIETIFRADGEYSMLEKVSFTFLSRVFNNDLQAPE